jgi:hypothetical protein
MPSPLAFNAISNTFARTVTATSQPLVPVIVPTPSDAQQETMGLVDYRITVVGTQPVWIAHSHRSAAPPTAVIPPDGTNARGVMIEGPMTYTIQEPYGTQFSVIAPAVGSTVCMTIGSGVAL